MMQGLYDETLSNIVKKRA